MSRIAAFTAKLDRHNGLERALIEYVRAHGWPPPEQLLASHHTLEEEMLRDMAEMPDEDIRVAIEAWDQSPEALL